MKYNTYLPNFRGFYGSYYESCDTDQIESNNCELENELSHDNYNFKFEQYFLDCSKEITNQIETILKDDNLVTSIVFEKLVSPKEYNFTNDSIDCEIEISEDNYKNIGNYLYQNIEAFETYILDNYSTRSGFISFMSNDVKLWVSQFKTKTFDKPEHMIGSILNFICQCEAIEEYDIYSKVCENVNLDYSYADETLSSEQKAELIQKEWL